MVAVYVSLRQIYANTYKPQVLYITGVIVLLVWISLTFFTKQTSPCRHETVKTAIFTKSGVGDCLQGSADKCLDLIFKTYGVKPRLLSFNQTVKSPTVAPGGDPPLVVPNIVHSVRFGDGYALSFTNYVSLKSVHKYIKPQLILIWGDYEPPENEWWARARKEVANIYLVYSRRICSISGKAVKWIQHESDWQRLTAIRNYGGIYLDDDVVVLRPFTPLRAFPFSLGRESNEAVSSAVIIGRQHEPFVTMWMDGYRDYNSQCWGCNIVVKANELAAAHPHSVHLEHTSLVHPDWTRFFELYGPTELDYTDNYSIHFLTNVPHWTPENEAELAGYNCTLGRVMRQVLYGRPQLTDTRHVNDGFAKRGVNDSYTRLGS